MTKAVTIMQLSKFPVITLHENLYFTWALLKSDEYIMRKQFLIIWGAAKVTSKLILD